MDLDDLLKSIREEGKGGKIVPAKFLGEDRYEKYKEELAAQGSIDGQQLTPQERKEGFKKRNDKIGFEQFVNKVLSKKKSATVAPTGGRGLPRAGAIVKAPGGAMQKFVQSPVGESTEKIVEEINQKLDDLIATIREEQKLEEKSLEKERVSAERDKRSKAENKLESGFTILKKSAEKILKPVKGIFDRIFDFIKKIILGNVLMKIIDWFADDENQGKIKTIFRFIEDFWPALTAAVLLFGTGIGGLVKGIIGTVVKLTTGLLRVVPKFLKFFATPLGAALGIVGGAAVGLISQATTKSNDPEAEEGQTQLDDTMDFGGTTGAPISGDMLGFNKGGFVSGGGPNRDTVPAMLSPGEFVMSRGAVQRYGKSTLESMNSVGGGTNAPVISQSTTYAKGGGMMPYSTVNTENESKLERRSKEEKKMMEAPDMPKSTGKVVGRENLPAATRAILERMDAERAGNLPPDMKTTGPLLGRMAMNLPIPGMGGGGGGLNALTNQAKVKSIPGMLSDLFGAFRKKEIDPQTILGDVKSKAKSIATSMGGTVVDSNSQEQNMKRVMALPPEMREAVLADMKRSNKNMSISQDQIQRTPIGPPTKPKPQVEFLPLGSGGANGQSAQMTPTKSQIPSFSASTGGSGNKMQTLGIG